MGIEVENKFNLFKKMGGFDSHERDLGLELSISLRAFCHFSSVIHLIRENPVFSLFSASMLLCTIN